MYEIRLEGEDEVLVTVKTFREVSDFIKNNIISNFNKAVNFDENDSKLMADMDEVFKEKSPWCLYIDETDLPLRYDIFRK